MLFFHFLHHILKVNWHVAPKTDSLTFRLHAAAERKFSLTDYQIQQSAAVFGNACSQMHSDILVWNCDQFFINSTNPHEDIPLSWFRLFLSVDVSYRCHAASRHVPTSFVIFNINLFTLTQIALFFLQMDTQSAEDNLLVDIFLYTLWTG